MVIMVKYSMDNDFHTYIEHLKQFTRPDSDVKGAVVMNCNPFTNGHRYLIEAALAEVDLLYLFLLEEDKSFFSFEDRLRLVKEGTADLNNIVVIPGGNYIISSITFPGYFTKEDNANQSVDPTVDVQIFGQFIAPALGISIRFAGTEPTCQTTRQYNETMRNLLPIYNLKFKEFERLMTEELPVSASIVRDYIKQKNFTPIKSLVPESTHSFIEERYG